MGPIYNSLEIGSMKTLIEFHFFKFICAHAHTHTHTQLFFPDYLLHQCKSILVLCFLTPRRICRKTHVVLQLLWISAELGTLQTGHSLVSTIIPRLIRVKGWLWVSVESLRMTIPHCFLIFPLSHPVSCGSIPYILQFCCSCIFLSSPAAHLFVFISINARTILWLKSGKEQVGNSGSFLSYNRSHSTSMLSSLSLSQLMTLSPRPFPISRSKPGALWEGNWIELPHSHAKMFASQANVHPPISPSSWKVKGGGQ